MIEKLDELLEGILEVDIVLPQSVIRIDQQVLSDVAVHHGLACGASRNGISATRSTSTGRSVSLGRFKFPFEQSFLRAAVEPRVNALQYAQKIHVSVRAYDARELHLAFDALGDGCRQILRVDFVERHRRAQPPAAAPQRRCAFGEPHDPTPHIAADVGHLHGQRIHIPAVELLIRRWRQMDLGRRSISSVPAAPSVLAAASSEARDVGAARAISNGLAGAESCGVLAAAHQQPGHGECRAGSGIAASIAAIGVRSGGELGVARRIRQAPAQLGGRIQAHHRHIHVGGRHAGHIERWRFHQSRRSESRRKCPHRRPEQVERTRAVSVCSPVTARSCRRDCRAARGAVC